jgi:hypothetical protein
VTWTAKTPSAGKNIVTGANPMNELLYPPDSPITRDSAIDPPNTTPRNTMSGELPGSPLAMPAIMASRENCGKYSDALSFVISAGLCY